MVSSGTRQFPLRTMLDILWVAGFALWLSTCAAYAQESNAVAAESEAAETTAVEVPLPPVVPQAEVLTAFGQFLVDQPDLGDDQRAALLQLIEAAQTSGGRHDGVITECLQQLSPDFSQALVLLADEDLITAVPVLQTLGTSENLYLATEAKFFLGKAYLMDENFEAALPIFEQLVTEPSLRHLLYQGETLFMLGTTQAQLLQREAAQKTLTQFLKRYPESAERLVVGAKHLLGELDAIEEGAIGDVQSRMEFSRRRLALKQSDQPTQQEQGKIITMLDKLIEEAEQQESQSRGSGSGSQSAGRSQGAGPGSGGGQSNANPHPDTADTRQRINRGTQGEGWGGLRDKQREEVLSAMKAKFPDRYKQLVDRYYQSLQNESEN